jgi:hypothetical protein
MQSCLPCPPAQPQNFGEPEQEEDEAEADFSVVDALVKQESPEQTALAKLLPVLLILLLKTTAKCSVHATQQA